MVVEETDGEVRFPRANAVNVRTMEFCRRWGIADEVRAAAIPPDYPHTAIYVTSLAGFEIARVERPSHGGDRPSAFSPEQPQRCNQLWFDPILRRRAEGFPEVQLLYRRRFESFEQDSECVVAEVSDLETGKQMRIVAQYLVACCGAHLNGPEGGYGMNTGMGDAVDLGWKLQAMCDGWGGADLLASYGAERRPIALRNVEEATTNFRRHVFDYSQILLDTAEGEHQRHEVGAALIKDSGRRHGHDGLALGYRYDPSPICWAEEGAAPADDTSLYVPSAHVGFRAPHAWLADSRSTIDLFGRGFVLLRRGAGAPDGGPMERAAEHCGVPIAVVELAEVDVRDIYQRTLVLVRPDGHVAWRGDAFPEDPLGVIDTVRGA